MTHFQSLLDPISAPVSPDGPLWCQIPWHDGKWSYSPCHWARPLQPGGTRSSRNPCECLEFVRLFREQGWHECEPYSHQSYPNQPVLSSPELSRCAGSEHSDSGPRPRYRVAGFLPRTARASALTQQLGSPCLLLFYSSYVGDHEQSLTGQSDSNCRRVLALQAANQGSIPRTPQDPSKAQPGVIPLA